MESYQYREIRKLLESGRPVVPLLGAGISFASGIPTTALIIDYIAKVELYFENDAFHPTWDPKRGAIRLSKEDHLDHFGYPDPYQLNAEMWQAANLRHQELKIEKDRLGRPCLAPLFDKKKAELGKDWSAVIESVTRDGDRRDALFQVLVRGRSPGASHRQLAFLTRRFGWRLILTINFDDLIERALISEGLDPTVYDVWMEAKLPASPLVRKGLSVVKLHGSAYGLRLLGKELAKDLEQGDKEKLCEYMGEKPVLLIAGWKGEDKRIRDLVQAVVHNDGEIIWVYFKPEGEPHTEKWLKGKQPYFVPTNDAGAFFGELYARVAGTHPVSKVGYSAHSQRPLGALDWMEKVGDLDKPVHLFTDTPSANVAGCASIRMSAFASQWGVPPRTIWVDVGTFQSVEELVVDVIRQCRQYDAQLPSVVLALHKEQADRIPLLDQPANATTKSPKASSGTITARSELVKAVRRIHEALRRGPYVLALDEIGAFGRPPTVHHGIPRARANEEHVKQRVNELVDFLTQLVQSAKECMDARICLAVASPIPRFKKRGKDSPPFAGIMQQLIRTLTESEEFSDLVCHHSPEKPPQAEQSGLTSLTENWDWDDLFALLCTFRRPRSIVALRKLAAEYYRGNGNFLESLDTLLEALHNRHILLRTEGGYYWMANPFPDTGYDEASDAATSRGLLRFLEVRPEVFEMYDLDSPTLEEEANPFTEDEKLSSLWSLARLAVQHRDIADYYYSDLFLASKDPAPLFEYLYHQVSSMRYATILEAFFRKLGDDQSIQLCKKRLGSGDAINPVETYLKICIRVGPAKFVTQERLNCVIGLWHTLRREEDFLLSHVPSDTLLSWVRWAREKDLSCLKSTFYGVNTGPDKDIEDYLIKFQVLLVGEEAKILRERTDYKNCIRIRVEQIEKIQEHIKRSSRRVISIGRGTDRGASEVAPVESNFASFINETISRVSELQQTPQHKLAESRLNDKLAEMMLTSLLDMASCYTRLGCSDEAEFILMTVHNCCKTQPRLKILRSMMRSYRISAERRIIPLDGWNAKNDSLDAEGTKFRKCQTAVKDCKHGLEFVREAKLPPVGYFRSCSYFRTHIARAQALMGNFDEAFQEFDRAVAGLDPEVGVNRGTLAVHSLYLSDALMLQSDRVVIDACVETVRDDAVSLVSPEGRLFLGFIGESELDDIVRRVTTPWITEYGKPGFDIIIPKATTLLDKLTGNTRKLEAEQLDKIVQNARESSTSINEAQALRALKRSLAYWDTAKLNALPVSIGSSLGKTAQCLTRAEVALNQAERLLDHGRRNFFSWYLLNRLRAQLQFEWMLRSLSMQPANAKYSTGMEEAYASFLDQAKTGLRAIRDAYDNIFEGSGIHLRFKMPLRILWLQLLIACGCNVVLRMRSPSFSHESRPDCQDLWERWIRLNRWTGLSFLVDSEHIDATTNNPYYEYFEAIYQSIPDTLNYSLAARAFVERHLKVFPNPLQASALARRS